MRPTGFRTSPQWRSEGGLNSPSFACQANVLPNELSPHENALSPPTPPEIGRTFPPRTAGLEATIWSGRRDSNSFRMLPKHACNLYTTPRLVDPVGFEPTLSCLQGRRAANYATSPRMIL